MIGSLVLAGALAAAPPSETPASWRTLAASGRTETRPVGLDAWRRLDRGDLLHADGHVRTGARSRATLAQHATVLVVDPASEVVLPREGAEPRVVQSRGAVLYDVDGRTHRGMTVETPTLVAGVKGTVFLVTVRKGVAIVTVREGLVAVTSRATGETVDVGAGEAALVEEGADGGILLRRAGDRGCAGVPPQARKLLLRDEQVAGRLASDDGLLATTTHATRDAIEAPASLLGDSTDRLLDDATDIAREVGDLVDDGGLVDDTRDLLDAVVKETTRLLPPLPLIP